ncbi:MAG: hypothetical protein MR006_01365 [Arcanobacterium sp.]|nr:hypothetical protein [Arcanobacterium sp.]
MSNSEESNLAGALSAHQAIWVWSAAAGLMTVALLLGGREHADSILAGAAFGLCALNTLIDWRTMTLIPLWSHLAGVLWIVQAGVYTVRGTWQIPAAAALCALVLGSCAAGVHRASPQSFGRGDVRLIVVLTLWVGNSGPFFVLLFVGCASALQLVAFAVQEIKFRMRAAALREPRRVLPFGAALVAGAWSIYIGSAYIAG